MRTKVTIWVLTAVTLGSGLVNLASVIGRSVPERWRYLHELFPLEFIHLSRFVTLVIGFTLVVSALNIYKRKRRAFQIVLVASIASVIFHLTKGLDYGEAVFSAVLPALLLRARKNFTVGSGTPDLREAGIRLAAALAVALGYGVAGFWLLDPREFGINFTIGDAVRRTLLFLSLVGDPGIVPHTRYAQWFLDSLYLMTVTAIAYSGLVMFQPVVYHFRTLPQERFRAKEITGQCGRSALDYFKYWPDKSFFFSDSRNCFIAYRVAAGCALALADPVGPEEEIEDTVRGFLAYCDSNDWKVGFYQTLPDFLPLYKRLGLRRLKIGDDAIVDLAQFNLGGRSKRSLRTTVNKLERAGVQVRRYEPPIPYEVLAGARAVSDAWLQIPGRRERHFTVGQFDKNYLRSTPLVVAQAADGRFLAFVNVIPSYRPGETTVDLMRHGIDVPNGVMEYLFVKLIEMSCEQGYERFSLGMAPLAGFREHEEASLEERAVHFFIQRLNFLFSYAGLYAFKAKFATHWEPRYLIYRNILDLPAIAAALARVSQLQNRE
jgi:phosphatidylglycerol lysyltransferase